MEWITSENPYEESWRMLLEYANVELSIEAIEKLHGAKVGKERANYRKQAEQARVALLQSKEYFEAARASSLFTQPNHLYYGAVSLATACMLIRGDGTKSLDYLRRDNKNSHHGLDFTLSSDANGAKQGISLLENSYIKVCKNGHFANWYNTLMKSQPVCALCTNHKARGSNTNLEEVGSFDTPSFQELENTKRTLSGLIKRLPDLSADLIRYGISVEYARGTHEVHTNLVNSQREHVFMFHYSPSHEVLMNIVKSFASKDGVNFCVEIEDEAKTGVIRTRKDKDWEFSYPDTRESLDHKVIFFKDGVNTPEATDLYMISYALSMLSRYFPDIWVSFLESHCKGAKLVERLVRVITLKLPSLMLNQISGRQYVISTHRPFWH